MKDPALTSTHPENLRTGRTTGSCVAAGAVAAWRNVHYGEHPAEVTLRLPGGRTLVVPIAEVRAGTATVIKDAGDDPDVTHGCRVVTRLEPFTDAPGPHDFSEPCSEGELVITCPAGIGVVTRPGLPVEVGRWAFNPGPRRILMENLYSAGLRNGRWRLGIRIPDGSRLALDTLNPKLGIAGGLSILGNSGIVRPYSHAAYAATIALQLRALAAEGGRTAALVTGNRTAAAIQRDYPALPPEAVIPIGDFIQAALQAADQAGLERIIVGCMPGKLFKYACGEANTHAHKTELLMSRLAEFSLPLPADFEYSTFTGMAELRTAVPAATWQRILEILHREALRQLANWCGRVHLEIAVYQEQGERTL